MIFIYVGIRECGKKLVLRCTTNAAANMHICNAIHISSCMVATILPFAPHFPENPIFLGANALTFEPSSPLNARYCSN